MPATPTPDRHAHAHTRRRSRRNGKAPAEALAPWFGQALRIRERVVVSPAMAALHGERIRHNVVFDLHHRSGSREEADFFAAAERLAAIPGVEAFELLRE